MLDKINRSPTCLFVQATQPVCRYVVVRQAVGRPVLVTADSFEIEGIEDLAESVRNQIESSVAVSRAVLLLPRGDVEVNSLELPPATDDEMPELVENMLAQQIEDSASYVHDFVMSKRSSDDSCDVLSFTVLEETTANWKQRFKEHGFKLEAITFGGIGAVNLLNQVSKHPARTSVVVTSTDQDIDLAVVEEQRPILFRTFPRAAGGEQFVIDQLASDIKRTLTLKGHPDDEDPRIYLIGTSDTEQTAAAQTLHEKLSLPVNLVNPFDQLAGDVKGAAKVKKPSRFANLIGTSCAWNQQTLQVNLLDPKRPPAPPTLWQRFGFWGVIAATLLVFAGYLAWEKAADQRLELEDQQVKLQRLIKPVKKAQTKQAVVSAVSVWELNDINWLDELHYLSAKLPPSEHVTVGGLTMTVGAGQRGRIEMPVVASESSVRLAVEEAIRDERHAISSKRLVDASNQSSSAWRFKTTISVAPARAKNGNSGGAR